MKKLLGSLILSLSLLVAVVQASNLLMGQSELVQTFPATTSIYFPFVGTHIGSTTATGSALGYSTTITGLIVTDAPTSVTPLQVRLVNLTTLQNNGIDPGSDFTGWPSGSSIGCSISSGTDGCSTTDNFTVTSTDKLIIRIQASNGTVTLFNHVTWYIPQ